MKQQHMKIALITGATSGFGKAIAEKLLEEGAHIIAVARRKEQLDQLRNIAPDRVSIVNGDITQDQVIKKVIDTIGQRQLHGALVNAGGPPAKTVMETTLDDWDNAYKNILRWKVALLSRRLHHPIEIRAGLCDKTAEWGDSRFSHSIQFPAKTVGEFLEGHRRAGE